jgi:uncharacterized RDD family membrane protein YckC
MPAPTLSYAGPSQATCPLCRKRPATAKAIYGHPVCKKCFYAFANRRQLGYLIDALIFVVPAVGYGLLIDALLSSMALTVAAASLLTSALVLPLNVLFTMKDGFTGRSLGRMATDTIVLDESTQQPIGFGKSFKRNAILLVGVIPIVGNIASLIVIITIAVQVARGYRLGDRFAQTKVIWRKYARLPVFGGTALVCETCGYDLYGNLSGTCPECGVAVSPNNAAALGRLVPQPVAGVGTTPSV